MGTPTVVHFCASFPTSLRAFHRKSWQPLLSQVCWNLSSFQRNPKYSGKGTVTTCFALIGLVAWKPWFDTTRRKLSVHSAPKARLKWQPLTALIALGAFFHSTPGVAQVCSHMREESFKLFSEEVVGVPVEGHSGLE